MKHIFNKNNYRKGKFKEVELLKTLNHLDLTHATKTEKELAKVLRASLQEISEIKVKWNLTTKLLQKIYQIWKP